MNAYAVTVRTIHKRITYTVLGTSSGAVHADALHHFGGLCGVTVKPV